MDIMEITFHQKEIQSSSTPLTYFCLLILFSSLFFFPLMKGMEGIAAQSWFCFSDECRIRAE
jgi:hypothetical protein